MLKFVYGYRRFIFPPMFVIENLYYEISDQANYLYEDIINFRQ